LKRWNSRALTIVAAAAAAATMAAACGKDSPTNPTPQPATLTTPGLDSPSDNQQMDTLRPKLTVRNATADQAGARTYEFQIADNANFSPSTSTGGFVSSVTKTGIAEDASGKTSFTPEQDLQPTTTFFWRARAVQGTSTGAWSTTGKFKSKLVGYNRAGELYDPLIHGETVGEVIGSATFIPGKGIQLNTGTSYVRYLLPQTITSGEFSMEVEGLRANAPGDKAKVFGMQEGQDDFITNRYRVDIQYRGVSGSPPNAITFRALYGSGSDLSKRYEPPTDKRLASVYLLNPMTVYYWEASWGSRFNLLVREGGIGGTTLYDYGMSSPNGTYAPNPQYAYLGAPVGRSGTESASIAGTIYKNVWLANHARPASLGSALR
jgi:hypothetical protein